MVWPGERTHINKQTNIQTNIQTEPLISEVGTILYYSRASQKNTNVNRKYVVFIEGNIQLRVRRGHLHGNAPTL